MLDASQGKPGGGPAGPFDPYSGHDAVFSGDPASNAIYIKQVLSYQTCVGFLHSLCSSLSLSLSLSLLSLYDSYRRRLTN
jgi:hypothetical protein